MELTAEDEAAPYADELDRLRLDARHDNLAFEFLGCLLLGTGIPLLLGPHLGWQPLVPWIVGYLGLVSVCVAVIRLSSKGSTIDRLVDEVWTGGTSFAIAWLPWLTSESRESSTLLAITLVIYFARLASNAIFMPQVYTGSWRRWLLLDMTSIAVATALGGHWPWALITVTATLYMLDGSSRLDEIVKELIGARRASERRASIANEQARLDPLTGCLNRRGIEEQMHKLFTSRGNVTCAFVDIDDLKQINDLFGYEIGDQAIVSTADHLRNTLGSHWDVARIGGDEFVAVSVMQNASTFLKDAADTLLRQTVDQQGLIISTTIGVTEVKSCSASIDQIFNEAGSAMRHAKASEKGQLIVVDKAMRDVFAQRVHLASRVEAALRDGEIVAWGQTVHDAQTGAIAGLECLARWEQPDGSVEVPATFVDTLERRGLGTELGKTMIDQALAFARRSTGNLRDASPYVAVNISPGHFASSSLVPEVVAALRRHQVEPSRLMIEVTESHSLLDLPGWQNTAERLRKVGVKLAIDDFGAGYSSLSELVALPADYLKLDRSLTRAAVTPAAIPLLTGVIEYSSSSGFVTIAEGVETQEELAAVRSLGVNLIQGWLFSRAEPLDDVLARMEAERPVTWTAPQFLSEGFAEPS